MKGKQNAYSLQQNKKFVLDKGYSLEYAWFIAQIRNNIASSDDNATNKVETSI